VLIHCRTSSQPSFINEESVIPVPRAELYLRFRGNPQKSLLLNLHGGPGGFSAIDIPLMGPGLEDHFLVAYLDQRGCGKSTGTRDTSLLTIDQYLQDLDIVIDSLRHWYRRPQVNLMGTSWGGMYGFLYLLQHQEKVNAFASIDGKVNSHYQNLSLIEHELQLVNNLLEGDLTPQRRTELTHIKEELLRIKTSDFSQFYEDVNLLKHVFPPKLGFNAYFADTSKIITPEEVLADSAMLHLMNYNPEEYEEAARKAGIVNKAFRNNPVYNTLNIEPELKKIRTPTCIIQGQQDYVVGVKHGLRMFKALSGLPQEKKELHLLPEVGHSPAIEAPDTLTTLLREFFGRYPIDE
jgi:pimeloyl-ACP methyl ester carboxylesterase